MIWPRNATNVNKNLYLLYLAKSWCSLRNCNTTLNWPISCFLRLTWISPRQLEDWLAEVENRTSKLRNIGESSMTRRVIRWPSLSLSNFLVARSTWGPNQRPNYPKSQASSGMGDQSRNSLKFLKLHLYILTFSIKLFLFQIFPS